MKTEEEKIVEGWLQNAKGLQDELEDDVASLPNGIADKRVWKSVKRSAAANRKSAMPLSHHQEEESEEQSKISMLLSSKSGATKGPRPPSGSKKLKQSQPLTQSNSLLSEDHEPEPAAQGDQSKGAKEASEVVEDVQAAQTAAPSSESAQPKRKRSRTRSKQKNLKRDTRPPELRPGGAQYAGNRASQKKSQEDAS